MLSLDRLTPFKKVYIFHTESDFSKAKVYKTIVISFRANSNQFQCNL
jgi:hypothetical protein